MIKKWWIFLVIMCLGCSKVQEGSMAMEKHRIELCVNEQVFEIALEDNRAVDELVAWLEEELVTIAASDFAGFEKVGSLGRSLSRSDRQMTTESGDIVLYNGNQIVIFYGSNSWSYTKLGKIVNLDGWSEALGYGDVTYALRVVEE